MPPLNWKVMTWSLGLFTTLTFVETFLYGAYAGLVFTGIHNVVRRRCA